MVKNPPVKTGDTRDSGSISGSGRSAGEGNWQLTPVFLPRKSHGQSSLAAYSPWGHEESDMTEWHRWKNSWKGAGQNNLESHLQSQISDRI